MFTRKGSLLTESAVTLFVLLSVPTVHLALARRGLSATEPTANQKPADELLAIRQGRVTVAQKGYDSAVAALGHTTRFGNTLVMDGKPEEVYEWSVRWLQAKRDMSPKRADQIVALGAHLRRITELEQKVEHLSRVLTPRTRLSAEWYRLEAQLWLAEEKTK
jgi:hypothetical protein